MIIYQIGPTGMFVGQRVIADGDGIPPGWTDIAPPSVGVGEVAMHTSGGWIAAPAPAAAPAPDPAAVVAQALADARAAKRAELEAVYQARLAAGFAYDFGGSHGVLHMQLRDADDKANWTAFWTEANGAVQAGQGAQPSTPPIRVAENVNVATTWQQALDAVQALRTWGGTLMAISWAIDDAITGAADVAALDAIDIAAGWN